MIRHAVSTIKRNISDLLFVRNEILTNSKYGNKALLIASFSDTGIETVKQTIYEYCELSRFSVDILNISKGLGYFDFKKLKKYRVIIVHNTAIFTLEGLKTINARVLCHYGGVKVLLKQDEHDNTNEFVQYIDKMDIDLLLSLWDVETANKIYKSNGLNQNMEIMSYLTGYVPEKYKEKIYWSKERHIDVGYRGSIQPMIYGKLAYEKRHIGEDFINYTADSKLICDISSRWEDRINGENWLYFLGSCKAVLGVESGSDIVDCTGEVKRKFNQYVRENPEASEEEILNVLAPFEGKMAYKVISPRHFEAAACGTLQILYEGKYQDIFKPYEHYIPLKRDFSNIGEVLYYINNQEERGKIIEQAYEDIILSDRFSFEKYVHDLDDRILKIMIEKNETIV